MIQLNHLSLNCNKQNIGKIMKILISTKSKLFFLDRIDQN